MGVYPKCSNDGCEVESKWSGKCEPHYWEMADPAGTMQKAMGHSVAMGATYRKMWEDLGNQIELLAAERDASLAAAETAEQLLATERSLRIDAERRAAECETARLDREVINYEYDGQIKGNLLRKIIIDEEALYLRVAKIFEKDAGPNDVASAGDVTTTVFLAIQQLLREGVFQLAPDDPDA